MKGLAAPDLGGKPEWKRKTDYYPISNNMKKIDSDGLLVTIHRKKRQWQCQVCRVHGLKGLKGLNLNCMMGSGNQMRCKFFMIDGSTQMFVVSKSIIQRWCRLWVPGEIFRLTLAHREHEQTWRQTHSNCKTRNCKIASTAPYKKSWANTFHIPNKCHFLQRDDAPLARLLIAFFLQVDFFLFLNMQPSFSYAKCDLDFRNSYPKMTCDFTYLSTATNTCLLTED